MTERASSSPAAVQGFVLPIVAVAIAVFALSVLTLVATVDDAATRVHRLKEDATFARRAVTAEARVAFLLATEPLRPGGVAVGGDRSAPFDSPPDARDRRTQIVRLDGRWYATTVEGQTLLLSLQDSAGLMNINTAEPPRLARLIEAAGVDPSAALPVAATLADFVDGDDARRPQGAERAEYARRGAPAPADAPLVDVRQAHDVLDWDTRVGPAQMRAFQRWAFAGEAADGLNVNTAPAPVLAAAFGIDDGRALQIVRRREAQIVRTSDDLAAVIGGGLQIDGQEFAAAPGRVIQLRVREAGAAGGARQIATSLVLAGSVENPPIGVGPRDNSPDPDQRSSDERLEPLPAGGRFPPR